VKEIDLFIIVFKYKDRFTQPFQRTLKMIEKVFGRDIWHNVVIDVSFWDADRERVEEKSHESPPVTEESYRRDIQRIFRNKFNLDFDLPVVFLDSYYTRNNTEEVEFFEHQVNELRKHSDNRRPFSCLTRAEVQAQLDSQQDDITRLRKKLRRLRAPLQRRIAHLEELHVPACNAKERLYETQCGNVRVGCSWLEWGAWYGCIGGIEKRTRERHFGPISESNVCLGEDTQNRTTVCKDTWYMRHDAWEWWEQEDTMAVMVGGEAEGVHNVNVAVLNGTNVCHRVPQLTNARTRPALAYTRAYRSTGGESWTMNAALRDFILTCGGLVTYGPNWKNRAASSCYKLSRGIRAQWTYDGNLKQAVAGAAMAWFQGEMWLVGGAKGDDSLDGTEISDKVQIYNSSATILERWRYHPKNFPRQVNRACAVVIDDDVLIVTGGTNRKVQQDSKWRGSQTTFGIYSTRFSWIKQANMREKRAGHGCEVAYVNGQKGVVVAGGSNTGDTAEFLDWENTRTWTMVKRLFKQRKFGLGLAYVGGNLTAVGGYYWPSVVQEVEQYDREREDWAVTSLQIEGRFNHGLVTVPGNMFPWCQAR